MGRAVFTPDLQYSHKHQGFLLYLSRLLRPLWNSTITVPTLARDEINAQRIRFSHEELSAVAKPLLALKNFRDRYPAFIPLSSSSAWDRAPTNMRMRLLDLQQRKQPEEALRVCDVCL